MGLEGRWDLTVTSAKRVGLVASHQKEMKGGSMLTGMKPFETEISRERSKSQDCSGLRRRGSNQKKMCRPVASESSEIQSPVFDVRVVPKQARAYVLAWIQAILLQYWYIRKWGLTI